MTGTQRMRRLQALFHEAVELGAEERAAYLDRECADDAALRAELEALLAQDAAADEATIAARVVPVAEAMASNATHGVSGQRIGSYRLIREIGSGGMGSVFLAERDDREFQHRVAIKLVRGFPTAPVLERFRRERELLATLRHTNIARLFDGGTTEAGQPYLVMEYIDGIPLDVWCREHQPTLHQRLKLFQSLCSAVQHAHQQLIVHRDLKPANVLVRADGEPALLDFGIGKLVADSESEAEATLFRALTPAYASPEQLRGAVATTLSDIYGLGLILFELLAGQALRKQGGDTTRLMASQVAAEGEAWLREDARTVRGDLDNIVRKALREEPERRYPTAAALSADIDAWFDGRPVSAAPDAWRYRLGKFVRRHPIALGATAATIIVLILLSARLAAERDRALAAQEQARLEAEGANQSASFLVDLFKTAAPESTRGEELTVRTLIDQARDELEHRQFSRPEIKARLETALGEIYHSLGLSPSSIGLLEQAVERLRAHGGAADGRVLARALTQLARAYTLAGRDQEALAIAREGLALNRQLQPIGHPEIGHSLQTLGVTEQEMGLDDDARAHFEEAERLFGDAGPDYRDNHAATLHNLGWAASRRGDLDEAHRILTRTLAIKHEVNGELHPSTFYTLSVLAQVEAAQGNFEAAIAHLRTLLAGEKQVLGEPNQWVAGTYNELGSTLQDAGRYVEAESNYRASIAQFEALGDGAAADRAISINNLATLLEDRERFDEAEARYRTALAMREAGGAQPRAIARGQHNLARLLLKNGRADEAETLAASAWQVRSEFAPDHSERLDALLLRASVALNDGRRAEAAEAWTAYSNAAAHADLRPAQRARGHEAAAEFAKARGDRHGEIAERRAVVELNADRLPAGHPGLARQRLQLAAALADGSDKERAEARLLLRQARDAIVAMLDPHGPTRALLEDLSATLGEPRA